ncbi:hypothetical protein [Ureibacillus sinduriensis]|uniref:Lipoprotein n=1 Tax=Ureibacillus sinduriensis BLB-1 = JCM 15800 TaxID=1384057 RepID=A0A0A3I460_9BACL|nr:hypothetical protein [Ureibacillus sinduriensis]KGR77458.1 hypothetical protein CD33_02905 [Ureibacillus sinduriensis BLB-1 = JCM 15800]
MRNLWLILSLYMMVALLAACNDEDKSYLTRVDVLAVEDEAMEEEEMIVDLITLDSIKSLLDEIHWQQDSSPDLERTEDLVVTLFYTENDNNQEQLYLYRMWFNSDDSLTIISDHEEEGYGTLDEEHAGKLKDLFLLGKF